MNDAPFDVKLWDLVERKIASERNSLACEKVRYKERIAELTHAIEALVKAATTAKAAIKEADCGYLGVIAELRIKESLMLADRALALQ